MADQAIKALNFQLDQVGKHVKASKKRYTWTISLKGRVHIISLDYSFISGKVKVVLDKKTLLENQLPPQVSFQYPFTLDGFSLNCIQQGQTFELRVNNKVFSHLYNQEKTNTEFKNYEDQIKDIKTDTQKFQPAKTVKLNIGAFGTKKKTNAKVETDNWNAFGGSQFPNYFQNDQNEVETTSKEAKLIDDDSDQQPNQQQTIIDFNPTPSQIHTSQIPLQYTNTSPQTFDLVGGQTQFNTLQNMFATQQQPTHTIPTNEPSLINDFNTMQQMFSTNNVKPNLPQNVDLFQIGNLQPINPPTTNPQSTNVPSNDFNTMQNLFSTNYLQTTNITQQQTTFVQSNQPFNNISPPTFQPNNINAQNFNTMQNLFSTNNQMVNNQMTNPMMTNQMINNQMSHPMVKQIDMNLQNQIGNNDFNTMQNLFKTGVKQQIKIDPHNSDDLFKNMGIKIDDKQPVSMNTMSGGKSGGFNLDINNFATMQQMNFSKKQPTDLL